MPESETQHNRDNHDHGGEQPQQQGGTPEEAKINTHQEDEGPGLGPAIGTIIIVAVLVLGAFYLWGQKVSPGPQEQNPTNQQSQQQGDAIAAEYRDVATSTELDSIERDLQDTNLQQLGSELESLSRELNQ